MTEVTIDGARLARRRLLAGGSRLALLRALEASAAPLDAHVLAERVGLHVNTVRWHLTMLVRAGLVTEATSVSSGRGRPRLGYRLVPGALEDEPGGLRLLAEMAIDALVRRDARGLASVVDEVGRMRGRALVGTRAAGRRPTQAEAVAEIVRLLDLFGFRPRAQTRRDGARISMHACPFGDLSKRAPEVVCELHLGLLRGTLEALDAPLEAAGLTPFVRPDLCVAELRRV